jgi:hypothetical protein
MRPDPLESIRAVQAALAGVIAPELTSAFAQDAVGTVQMLLESMAAEWDTAADELRKDNETLTGLLAASRDVLEGPATRNENVRSIVTEIETRLGEGRDDSLTLSTLASRNYALRASLERTLELLDEMDGEIGYEATGSVRRDIYAHLRSVATRGWSFWDVSSFRGRMAEIRSAPQDDAHGVVR